TVTSFTHIPHMRAVSTFQWGLTSSSILCRKAAMKIPIRRWIGSGAMINMPPEETMTTNKLSDAVVVERTFKAPVARVWQALTDVEQMRQWYFDLKEFKPQVGLEF